MKINVLVSSWGERLLSFLDGLSEVNNNVQYIIGHQSYNCSDIDKIEKIISLRKDIIYFKLDTIGVTKSRNFLLEHAKSDIIFFCDDDIIFEDDFVEKINYAHTINDATVITFAVINEFGEYRKKYPQVSKNEIYNRTIFSILSVGTIEISIKNTNSKIRFPEDMGAGSINPIGDEAVFLSKYIKANKKIIFTPTSLVMHPDESSGGIVTTNSIYSRGMTIRRVFGFRLGFFILPVFFCSRLKLFKSKDFSMAHSIHSYLKGFFKKL